ncbi:T9SS type A sorting domain-containing protein [Desertivirga xinjiangensis]|uniref:T9SS type A sorting domain-containing protein n=1 Tax=Desertivirga xinjiangensis TaxID=539206 RepID=UPI00210BAC7A|nr:T9SS type A sorting domain-containing protein [Pedobacter xinjiangensis]
MKTTIILSGFLVFSMAAKSQILDPSKVLLDYNGPDASASSDASPNWGNGYGANNVAFIAALRKQVLPVELISFSGKKSGQVNILSWKTAFEINNSRFEVLRSEDAKSFSLLSFVLGKGNSSVSSSYNFIDQNPLPGTNYYRLRQVDFNGKESLSAVVVIETGLNSTELTVFSAWGTGLVKGSVYTPVNSAATIHVLDVSGRELGSLSLNLQKGDNGFSIPVNLQSGIYILSLRSPSVAVRKKFIQ